MYGKIFEQIYDSSIAEDWTVRTVFQDLIILSDENGVVDRTPESIARRTNVPLDIVLKAIAILEAPDPKSRSKEADGARILKLDPERQWGWEIVNHAHYRGLASEAQRREKTKLRTRKYRDSKEKDKSSVTMRHGASPYASVSVVASESLEGGAGETRTIDNGFRTPTLEEVKGRAAIIGLVEWSAIDFYEKNETTGWQQRGMPMINWQAALNRHKTYWEADGRPMSPPRAYANSKTNGGNSSKGFDRNKGTLNEGTASDYQLSKVPKRV